MDLQPEIVHVVFFFFPSFLKDLILKTQLHENLWLGWKHDQPHLILSAEEAMRCNTAMSMYFNS